MGVLVVVCKTVSSNLAVHDAFLVSLGDCFSGNLEMSGNLTADKNHTNVPEKSGFSASYP